MKIDQYNHRTFKKFDNNQSESSITYKENFIFYDINQSETNLYSKWSFQQFWYQPIRKKYLQILKYFIKSESIYVHEASQLINLIDFFQDK